MQDIHLLPKTFQAVIAGQENAFLYRGFPRDALSLLKLVMGNTNKQEGSGGELLAGRGGSSFTLPPCDLIKAIEHRDEFEDFPDDFPDYQMESNIDVWKIYFCKDVMLKLNLHRTRTSTSTGPAELCDACRGASALLPCDAETRSILICGCRKQVCHACLLTVSLSLM